VEEQTMADSSPILPSEAYERLMSGNRRFVAGRSHQGAGVDPQRRAALTSGQSPFATVLTCADSRVPPEHVFDAGLGELFVCRNAGNLVDELILGSIEYAVAHLDCPLVCVLGHSSCGACGAAVAAAAEPEVSESPNVDDILRRLSPAVLGTLESFRGGGDGQDRAAWVEAVARRNVELVCRQIFDRSRVITARAAEGKVHVMGAMYDLASGSVEVLVPPESCP
jgi:carbonic anhydrase